MLRDVGLAQPSTWYICAIAGDHPQLVQRDTGSLVDDPVPEYKFRS
jgi:hypothetical protein